MCLVSTPGAKKRRCGRHAVASPREVVPFHPRGVPPGLRVRLALEGWRGAELDLQKSAPLRWGGKNSVQRCRPRRSQSWTCVPLPAGPPTPASSSAVALGDQPALVRRHLLPLADLQCGRRKVARLHPRGLLPPLPSGGGLPRSPAAALVVALEVLLALVMRRGVGHAVVVAAPR